MNQKNKARGTYEDDLEDQYFEDDEDNNNSKQKADEEEEIDPLDAYMQDLNKNAGQDQTRSNDKDKNTKQEILVSDDPLDSFMDSMKDKLIKDYNKKHNIKKKDNDPDNEDEEGEEDVNYEFLNEEGDLDFDALKKMKKQKIEPLAAVDHSKIQYEPFNKDFYEEHEELKALPNDRVKQLRQEMEMRVHGRDVPKPLVSFGHLPFDDKMKNLILKKSFEKPTAIQCQALPCVLSGRDVIGIAKTGSGKTLAYVWPLIIHVLDQREIEKNEGPIGLIMCPTRELAQQVYIETKNFAKIYNCKVAALLGGENKHEQWKELKAGVDIIVATPGRLIEMVKKKATNLKRCTYVVLDEADRMFSMGFEYQIRSIINQIRPDRQILLFSATFRDKIQKLCIDILHDPIRINIGKDNQANEDVKQEVIVVTKPEDKTAWLFANLAFFEQTGKVLIFANQIGTCEDLAKQITEGLNLNTLVLHGDKLQQERTMIINNFKTKSDQNILVATDVASRGLDIPDIRSVINFEVPKDGDTYIHRIGRTGRAGNKEGTAYTLLLNEDLKFALTLTKILEVSGQPVPKELEDIALLDEEYVRRRKMKKMGFNKNNAASKLLEKALSRNKRDTTGLGYNKEKAEDNTPQSLFNKNSSASFVKSSFTSMPQTFVPQQVAYNPPVQQAQSNFVQYTPQATAQTYYQSPQTSYQTNTPYQSIQSAPTTYSGQNRANAREELMAQYNSRLKNNLQTNFNRSFVASGSLEASKGLPTITFKNKPPVAISEMEPKSSNITIQLPKKKNRFSEETPVESNLDLSKRNYQYMSKPYEGDIEPTKKFNKGGWDRRPEGS